MDVSLLIKLLNLWARCIIRLTPSIFIRLSLKTDWKLYFKQAFRLLIVALYASIPAVGNAMIITFIVTAVYAIVATNVFSSVSPDYFADFGTSMFSMFQVRQMLLSMCDIDLEIFQPNEVKYSSFFLSGHDRWQLDWYCTAALVSHWPACGCQHLLCQLCGRYHDISFSEARGRQNGCLVVNRCCSLIILSILWFSLFGCHI